MDPEVTNKGFAMFGIRRPIIRSRCWLATVLITNSRVYLNIVMENLRV